MNRDDAEAKAAAVWGLMGMGIAAATLAPLDKHGKEIPANIIDAWQDVCEWFGEVAGALGIEPDDRLDAYRGGIQFGKEGMAEAIPRIIAANTNTLPPVPDRGLN